MKITREHFGVYTVCSDCQNARVCVYVNIDAQLPVLRFWIKKKIEKINPTSLYYREKLHFSILPTRHPPFCSESETKCNPFRGVMVLYIENI